MANNITRETFDKLRKIVAENYSVSNYTLFVLKDQYSDIDRAIKIHKEIERFSQNTIITNSFMAGYISRTKQVPNERKMKLALDTFLYALAKEAVDGK